MDTNIDIEKLWQRILEELKLQMTRATFETWLQDTKCISIKGGTITVAVKNGYAVEWLEHRLSAVIKRTLARNNLPYEPKYVVATEKEHTSKSMEQPDSDQMSLHIELVEYDPTKRGYIQTASYALRFWLPYIGRGPFLLWQLLRSYAYGAGQSDTWPTLKTLAIILNTDRNMLTGRKRKDRYHEGWLDVLEHERIVWSQIRNSRYVFRVLDSLPLLTQRQANHLPQKLQKAHGRWLDYAKLNRSEWEQMTLPSMVKSG